MIFLQDPVDSGWSGWVNLRLQALEGPNGPNFYLPVCGSFAREWVGGPEGRSGGVFEPRKWWFGWSREGKKGFSSLREGIFFGFAGGEFEFPGVGKRFSSLRGRISGPCGRKVLCL